MTGRIGQCVGQVIEHDDIVGITSQSLSQKIGGAIDIVQQPCGFGTYDKDHAIGRARLEGGIGLVEAIEHLPATALEADVGEHLRPEGVVGVGTAQVLEGLDHVVIRVEITIVRLDLYQLAVEFGGWLQRGVDGLHRTALGPGPVTAQNSATQPHDIGRQQRAGLVGNGPHHAGGQLSIAGSQQQFGRPGERRRWRRAARQGVLNGHGQGGAFGRSRGCGQPITTVDQEPGQPDLIILRAGFCGAPDHIVFGRGEADQKAPVQWRAGLNDYRLRDHLAGGGIVVAATEHDGELVESDTALGSIATTGAPSPGLKQGRGAFCLVGGQPEGVEVAQEGAGRFGQVLS